MWHIVDFGCGDVRVLHDDSIDELEGCLGPHLGAKLLESFEDKWEAEDYLDKILAG